MAHPAMSVLVCLAAAYAIAITVHPLLRRRDAISMIALAMSCGAVVACLFIVPREQVILRASAAIFVVDLFFRLIDFTRQTWRGGLQTVAWRDYCHFLIPFPWLLAVFSQKDRQLPRDQRSVGDLFRLLLGSVGVAIGFGLLFAANGSPFRQSFVLDYVAKPLLFLLTVEALYQALCGLERLMGFETRPNVDRAYLSRTPADFWRRFNIRAHAWLYFNAFVPAGGRRAPMRGVGVAFLVSGLVHEVGFDIATSHVTGYQLIFFLLQIPAVLFSGQIEQLSRSWGRWGSALAHAITVLWLGATSVLFFDGVGRIFPFFYTR